MSDKQNNEAATEKSVRENYVNEEKVLKPKSLLSKLNHVKSNISVEPILAGLTIPSRLARLATQNLNLDKACRVKLNLNDTVCDALIARQGNLAHEVEVQEIISNIESWRSVIHTAVPMLLVIFIGAWSDRTGNRKVCILLPIVGEVLVCGSNLLSTFFFKEISVETTVFLETIFPAITGGFVVVHLGVFSYISDITDEKSRTFRIGLANLCQTAGLPIGTALSGIMLNLVGYYGVFLISGSIYLITIIYGCYCLESNTKPGINKNEEIKPVTCSEMIILIKETGKVAIKSREYNLRKKILFTLLLVAIVYGPHHAEMSVFYLYLRYKLNWDAFKYSMYLTYKIITHGIGALFSITVFSKRWGFHDSMLCLISIVSKLAGSILIAFVQTDVHMYMVPLVELLNATTFTSLRSMASKLVTSEELGKINSLFSLVETVAALMFDPTYSVLYSKTITIFSGTVFILSAVLTLPAVFILVWIFVRHRREINKKIKSENKEMTVYENHDVEKYNET